MQTPLVYRDQPLFGFDLGSRTAKLLQLQPSGHGLNVLGYGYADFPAEAIVEGIIVDPQEVVAALAPLLKEVSYGRITASRVATALPVAKVFTRILQLPPMNPADLGQAVRLEAEQYIPVPLPDLYIDYEIVDSQADKINVLMVAAPRAIVDSYVKLFELMNLEVSFIESSLSAVSRAILSATKLNTATLIADIGSNSIDLTVYDRVIRLTDTIPIGGDNLTTQMVGQLGITRDQANEIKFKFGIGPSGLQDKITAAVQTQLDTIVSEIQRVLKYYQDRSDDKRTVEAIILAGGSASMPGLIDFLSPKLGVPVAVADPWEGLKMAHHLPAVSKLDAPMYTTAIGLARLETFK